MRRVLMRKRMEYNPDEGGKKIEEEQKQIDWRDRKTRGEGRGEKWREEKKKTKRVENGNISSKKVVNWKMPKKA